MQYKRLSRTYWDSTHWTTQNLLRHYKVNNIGLIGTVQTRLRGTYWDNQYKHDYLWLSVTLQSQRHQNYWQFKLKYTRLTDTAKSRLHRTYWDITTQDLLRQYYKGLTQMILQRTYYKGLTEHYHTGLTKTLLHRTYWTILQKIYWDSTTRTELTPQVMWCLACALWPALRVTVLPVPNKPTSC